MTPVISLYPSLQNPDLYDAIVIGGGFAGTFSAVDLVKKGYRTLHINLDPSILGDSSSSDNQCFKAHLGVHYMGDAQTAYQCLIGSIEFARDFPQFLEGKIGDPWRRGRHYVVSNSLYQPEPLCEELVNLYRRKVEDDERNAVFGDPDDLIKYLNPEDYPYIAKEIPYTNEAFSLDICYAINPSDIKTHKIYLYLEGNQIKYKALNKKRELQEVSITDDEMPEAESIKNVLRSEGEKELTPSQKKSIYSVTSKYDPFFCEEGLIETIYVKTAIETPESQINISKLRAYLQQKLAKHENYTFLPNTRVTTLSFDPGTLNYQVGTVTTEGGTVKHNTYTTAGIINCSWHKIEELDRQLGYIGKDEQIVNSATGSKKIKKERVVRIKISLLVELPPSLKNVNTCIFSCGPHFSFTNLGDGTAILTYEPVTNAGSYRAGTVILNDDIQAFYKEKLVPESGKGKELADKIMDGCAKYFPDLRSPECKVKKVRLGHVKIFVEEGESYSLTDKDSAIHKRQETGVEPKGLCFFDFSGMKMTYAIGGAKVVGNMLEAHFFTRRKLLERGSTTLAPNKHVGELLRRKNMGSFYNYILYNVFRNFTVDTTRSICEKTFSSNASSPDMIASEIENIDRFTKATIMEGIQQRASLVAEINALAPEPKSILKSFTAIPA